MSSYMSKGPEFCLTVLMSERGNFLINRHLSYSYYLCLFLLCRNLIQSGSHIVALFKISISSLQVFFFMPVSMLCVMLEQGTVAIEHEFQRYSCSVVELRQLIVISTTAIYGTIERTCSTAGILVPSYLGNLSIQQTLTQGQGQRRGRQRREEFMPQKHRKCLYVHEM